MQAVSLDNYCYQIELCSNVFIVFRIPLFPFVYNNCAISLAGSIDYLSICCCCVGLEKPSSLRAMYEP